MKRKRTIVALRHPSFDGETGTEPRPLGSECARAAGIAVNRFLTGAARIIHRFRCGEALAASLVSVVGVVAVCSLASAGIKGSKHDFSGQPGVDRCGVCHVSQTQEAPKAPPLWNLSADLSRRFGRAQRGAKASPGSGTLICLQCHDGTIAKDATGSVVTQKKRFVYTQHPGPIRAGHGRTDHPVGVAYPTISRDFRPPTTVLAKRTVLLPAGQVECTSCHDPHNDAGQPHFLVMSNARSALCLTCHKK